MASHEQAPKSNAEQQESQEISISERLSQIDVKEITPEDVEFMNSAIQNYMKDHYPVPGEIIDEIPNHVQILGKEDFADIYEKTKDKYAEIALEHSTGLYNTELGQMFINAEAHQTPEQLFATMLHEADHYAAISNGAGFRGPFLAPDNILQEPEDMELARSGYISFCEGATQRITEDAMEDMGISTENVWGYAADVSINRQMFKYLPSEDLHQRYFQDPTDKFRQEVEACLIEDDTERMNFIQHRAEISTGKFAIAMRALGAIKRDAMLAADNDDRAALKDISNAIARSMQYYQSRREALDV